MTTALVLAGGGVAGIAWELGVLSGLADVEPELAGLVLAADTVIGTSAGSAVAAQVTSGASLEELYAAQIATDSAEIDPGVDLASLVERLGPALAGATDEVDAARRLGAIALETPTVDEATRLVAIRARLPRPDWPDRDLRITAVDAFTGERVVLDRSSGVTLTDAVAASCAIPGIWPPATVGGTRLLDGGVHSATHADLAAGADRVLVVVPTLAGEPPLLGRSLDDELAGLARARVHVIFADDESVAAFGDNPLDVATRGPAARAGRQVGRLAAPAVGDLLLT
ncbi:MAG: hypothetical protein JWO46_2024 [Nocardioidaceae bacterium]|nr:hypothetical protein [Nocardioidaceae bacterium]